MFRGETESERSKTCIYKGHFSTSVKLLGAVLIFYQSCYRSRYKGVQTTVFSCNFIILSLRAPLIILGLILNMKKFLQHILKKQNILFKTSKISYSKGKSQVFY